MRWPFRCYYGWNIVVACVVSQLAAIGMALNCFSLFVSGWGREFGVPVSQLTLGVTLLSFGGLVLAAPAGALIERRGVRWIFAIGLAGVVVAHVAIGFATASWQIIAVYALPLSVSLVLSTSIASQAVVARWFVRRPRPIWLSCSPMSAWSVGWRRTSPNI